MECLFPYLCAKAICFPDKITPGNETFHLFLALNLGVRISSLLCSALQLHLKHCLLSQCPICLYNSFLNTLHHGDIGKPRYYKIRQGFQKAENFFDQTLLSSTMLSLTPAVCRKRLLCNLTWASFVVWPPSFTNMTKILMMLTAAVSRDTI